MTPKRDGKITYAAKPDMSSYFPHGHAGPRQQPSCSRHLFLEDELVRGLAGTGFENGRELAFMRPDPPCQLTNSMYATNIRLDRVQRVAQQQIFLG